VIQPGGGAPYYSVSAYLFAATVKANVTGLTITSQVPSTSSGLAVNEFSPGAGAATNILTHGHHTSGQDMKVGPLTCTPSVLGLDFGIAVATAYPEGTVTPASGYTITGNGALGYEAPSFHTFYKANDSSGSATPEVVYQNGTYGAIVGAVV